MKTWPRNKKNFSKLPKGFLENAARKTCSSYKITLCQVCRPIEKLPMVCDETSPFRWKSWKDKPRKNNKQFLCHFALFFTGVYHYGLAVAKLGVLLGLVSVIFLFIRTKTRVFSQWGVMRFYTHESDSPCLVCRIFHHICIMVAYPQVPVLCKSQAFSRLRK